VVEPTQANFVSTQDFLNFLREYGDVALRVAQQLGQTYHAAIAEMRAIGLSHSVREKLARFMLDLTTDHVSGKGALTTKLTLTHEEIAEIIGTSRETVTRTLTEFKRKNLVSVKGSVLTIKDRLGLERLIQG
jgi:CRP/FNR family transcriptional regulator